MTSKPRAGIHARRSLNRADEQSASVRRQFEVGRELAERLGAEVVVEWDEDDTSAFAKRLVTLPNGRRVRRNVRPVWQEILTFFYDGRIDILIEYDLDRAMREPRDLEDLIEIREMTGRRVESVTGSLRLLTDADITMARVLVAMGNKSSRDTARRVRDSARDRATQGLNHGGRRSFGFTLNGREQIPEEARELARIYDELLSGVPLGTLVRDLNGRNVTTVTGAAWSSSSLRGALLRPRHAGLASYLGEVVGKGQWDPIVPENVWRAAVALLQDPDRRTSTGNRASYLLSGIGICGVCGNSVTAAGLKGSGENAAPRRVYRCRQRPGKTGYCLTRRLDWCDQYVADAMVRRLGRPAAPTLLVDQSLPNYDGLRIQAQALRERLDEGAAGFADGLLTASQLRTITTRVKAQLADVEAQQERQGRPASLSKLIGSDDVQATWDALTLDHQRAVVKTLADVVLHPGGGGKRTFDPTKIEIRWRE